MLRLLPNATRPRAARIGTPGPSFAALPSPRAKRILSFDIENKPLSYWYDGRCTAEVTAIAYKFVGGAGACGVLGEISMEAMLEGFRTWYDNADIVTGHYIRKHDLPIINAAMFENGLPLLGPKLTSDTRLDLARWSELPKSQEYLGDAMDLAFPKEHMSQKEWREANRGTPEGLEQTRRRVIGDVEQHIEMRAALIGRGLLGPPRWWSPGGVKAAA